MAESSVKTALVIVSHSQTLARGVVELAVQMAPDVPLLAAAGTADGGIGTSYDRIEAAVSEARAKGLEVVVFTDLGSATMTVESVLEFYADEPVYFADAPLVEAVVAGAVTAQQGEDARSVLASALQARQLWSADAAGPDHDATSHPAMEADRETVPPTVTATHADGDTASAHLTIGEPEGLHARPAALLAQLVNASGTRVHINGVEANSVLALMSAGIRHGDQVQVQVSGPQAQAVLEQIAHKLTAGFNAS